MVHSIVERRRSPLPYPGLVAVFGAGSRKPPLLRRVSSGEVRSLEDRECARPLLSLRASALVGDLSVLGIASSSMVRPRDFGGDKLSVRLRMVMPWRCLSLRFCQTISDYNPSILDAHTYASSHGRSRGGDLGSAAWDSPAITSLIWLIGRGGDKVSWKGFSSDHYEKCYQAPQQSQ